MGTKKRKHDGPLDDIERSLYSSFSAAANGISVLYTQALTQQRKAYCLGSRAMAERVLGWLEGESEQVSTSVLMALLRHELADLEGHAAELALASQEAHSQPPPTPVSHPHQEAQKLRGQLRPPSDRQNATTFAPPQQSHQAQGLHLHNQAVTGSHCMIPQPHITFHTPSPMEGDTERW